MPAGLGTRGLSPLLVDGVSELRSSFKLGHL